MARGWLCAVVVCLVSGCYASHRRHEDAGAALDAPRADVPDAPRCAPACSGSAPAPIFHATFDGHADAIGPAGFAATRTGAPTFVPGVVDRALRLPLESRIDYPGTAELLRRADALTFSIWVRHERFAQGRTFLGCRSHDRGFESYRGTGAGFTPGNLTTCAGDGAGPPRAWGACANVLIGSGSEPWTHFVLRWAGPGTEPEVASDCSAFWPLHAHMDFPVGALDLFDGATDLDIGRGAGDGALATGRIDVDDLRIYDVALPDDVVWEATTCPTP
jgi:hypothetical protein